MTVLRPGQRLGGRYQIICHLGGGGFGQTYKAEDEQRPDNPPCVVKQLKPQSTDPETLELAHRLFETEAKTLYKLGEHPQIPELLAHFEEDNEFYLVQEFIDGHDLTAELTPGQPLNQSDTIDLLQKILEVLTFVHQEKVIHRDLKPQNIRRRKKQDGGNIVLIDFGAVKEITSQMVNSQGQVALTAPIGTPGYMPPEQAQGMPKLCSDVHAVGMIGIQALTGINPDPRCGALPRNPQGNIIWSDRAKVSSNLAKILDKMVSFHFSERYQSAAEALQALQALTNSTKKSRPWAAIIGPIAAVAIVIWVIGLNVSKFIPPRPIAQNFLTYEDPEYGFSIALPQSWEAKKIGDVITRTVVVLESPKENVSDKFQEQLRVRIKDRSANSLTLDDYTKSSLNKIKRSRTIVDSGSTNLANSPAYRVVYRSQDEEYSLQWLEVWTIIGDRIYIITYEAEADKYSDFLSTAEEMIDSFEITPISSPLPL